ncbi:MAG: hypothetical protein NT020_12830 [Chloroflexales bacterium]|nr:hypothetical protein [Chloroflexales bacterium]
MDVTFASKKLQKICASPNALIRVSGVACARNIQQRLMVLLAFTTYLSEFVPMSKPERCHELKGDRQVQLAMDIGERWRLLYRPNHQPLPRKPDGGLDWHAVTAIIITEISDHYD